MKQLSNLFSFRLSLGFLLLGLLLLFDNYSLLPDQMAAHFNIQGEADGNSHKAVVVGLMSGLMIFLFFLISFIAVFLGNSFGQANIPNKEFWINEENLPAAVYISKNTLMWILCMTMILMDFIIAHLIYYNFNHESLFPFWIVLLVYLVTISAIVATMFLKFRMKKN